MGFVRLKTVLTEFIVLNKAMFTSDRKDWNTPFDVLELVRKVAPIGLDPCSNENSVVYAKTTFDVTTDGLSKSWAGHGLVYVNPPYGGKESQTWAQKIEGEAWYGVEIVALFPSRTDTKWFHRLVKASDARCLWRSRLKFLGAPSSAPFPSVLFYFGPNAERFRAVFEPRGYVW